MSARPPDVFVVGLDEANLRTLRADPGADELRFHRLLTIGELQHGEVAVPDAVDKARHLLDDFDGPVDAIVGYWDCPVSTLVALLAKEHGTPATTPESAAKCEHKYWSRPVQQEVATELPLFGRMELDSPDPWPPEGVRFPMWLKPALS